MEPQGLFNQTFSVLEKSMNLRSQKHILLTSNIANMDTPNYKAFDIMVEEEMGKTSKEAKLPMNRTQPAHIPLAGMADPNAPEIRPVEKSRFDFHADGNTVDIDRTMFNLSENGLLYNASAQMISKKFQALTNAINGTVR
jgi:flagellar basal-body rod protein FlgB